MGYFQNIINSVKNTYANITAYLTQPVRNNAGQVVGNRVTMVLRDIQTQIMHRCYFYCINRVSTIVIMYIVSFSANVVVVS